MATSEGLVPDWDGNGLKLCFRSVDDTWTLVFPRENVRVKLSKKRQKSTPVTTMMSKTKEHGV